MKKIAFLITLTIASLSFAQSYIGFQNDNYGGLYGVVTNPGNLADSRTKVDINLISANAIIATDYTYLGFENISNFLGDEGFDGLERFPTDANEILTNIDVMGPSFMFSLSEKHSIGLITRLRLASNFNNINGTLFESLYDGFPIDNFSFEQSNLDFTTHAWGEIGLAYGYVIPMKSKKSYLKTGITLKYLLGGGAAQGTSRALEGNYNISNDLVNLTGDFGYTLTYDENQDSADYFSELSPGFGMDVGLVYEYRTTKSQAASNANNPRAFNQYKFKIGVSVTDIGAITYRDVETTDYAINGAVSALDLEDDFATAVEDASTITTNSNDVKVVLPTALNLNFDYHLSKKLYLNLDIDQSLVKKNNFFNNNRLNRITLTPRFESRVLGAYLPLSYSRLGSNAVGLGVRLGPLMIGSGTLLSSLVSNKDQTANIFAGFKLPINHKRKLKGDENKK